MSTFLWIKSFLLLITLGLALYYDIREHKVKNFITLPAAAAGFIVNYLEQGLPGLLFALKGWAVPVLVLLVLYYMNVMGAGDIKLFGAIGAIMGLPFVISSFVYTVYIGGLIAVCILVKRKIFWERMKYLFNYFKFIFLIRKLSIYSRKDDRESKFIFTIAIVPGTVLQLLLTALQLKGVKLFGGASIWF